MHTHIHTHSNTKTHTLACRHVSSQRLKTLLMTHPSMRAASMAAAGLRDDDDDDGDDGGGADGGGGYGDSDDGGSDGDCEDEGEAPRDFLGAPDAAALGTAYAYARAAPRRACGQFQGLSSDGGSSIRRSMGRYRPLGARARPVLF